MNTYVSKNAISHYTEGETFSSVIQPAFSSNADTTNAYGTWSIHAYTSIFNRDDLSNLYQGFDLNSNSNASLGMLQNEDASYELVCPVAIKPTKVGITHRYLKNGYFQGYNPINKTWETLGTFTGATSRTSTSLTPTTNNYYTKFRLYTDEYYSSSYTNLYLYLLAINQGVIGVPVYGDVSTKAEKVYVGVNDLSKKVSKIYAGVNGISKLVWSYYPKYFNELFFPNTWEKISNTDFITTTSLGTWEITSTSNNSANTPDKGCDGKRTTLWVATSGSRTTYQQLTINCPVEINPIKIALLYARCGNTTNPAYFEGYNVNTNTWDILATLQVTGANSYADIITISTNNYYNAFRVNATWYNNSYSPTVTNMNIIEGYYKP